MCGGWRVGHADRENKQLAILFALLLAAPVQRQTEKELQSRLEELNWPATHPLRAVSNWVLQTPRFRGDSLVPLHRLNYHFRFIARSSKPAYIKPHIMMLPSFFRTLHAIRETKILTAGLDG